MTTITHNFDTSSEYIVIASYPTKEDALIAMDYMISTIKESDLHKVRSYSQDSIFYRNLITHTEESLGIEWDA